MTDETGETVTDSATLKLRIRTSKTYHRIPGLVLCDAQGHRLPCQESLQYDGATADSLARVTVTFLVDGKRVLFEADQPADAVSELSAERYLGLKSEVCDRALTELEAIAQKEHPIDPAWLLDWIAQVRDEF